ncbi:tetratricopeptide repeat protein [Aquirufa aurantiipilula]
MKYLLIISWFFLISCTSQLQYQTGISKFTNQDYLGANMEFSEALLKDKRNDEIYFARAASRSLAGYHSLAIADMNKAISLNDSRADYFYFRGYFKSQLAYHKSAIKDYSICISKAPWFAEVYRLRALSFIEVGDLNEACLDIQEAIAAGDTASYSLQEKYCSKKL